MSGHGDTYDDGGGLAAPAHPSGSLPIGYVRLARSILEEALLDACGSGRRAA